MEESINDETSISVTDYTSGITPSNNFLGLLPLPYSMSVLKSSLTSSYADTYVPQTSTNNNHTSYSYRTPSRSVVELNKAEHYSNPMSSRTYRSSSVSMSKPFLFQQSREKERVELSTLNDTFADYVEKVRYLEAQNKKIQMDTNLLCEKQQDNCQRIKSMFEIEVAQVKAAIEKLLHKKNTTVIVAKEAQNAIPPLKQRLTQSYNDCDASIHETEKIEQQLSSVEGDILMFKRRLAHQDNEHTQWKHFINHIQRLSLQAKNEIHNETLTRTTCEQGTRQLRIDIDRLREQQQQKLKDLTQTSFLLGSNSTNDRAHIFKSELSNAIRKIRQDAERQNDLQRNELYEQFTQVYEELARENPDIGYLFANEHEQERIKQEEEHIRSEIHRVQADSNIIKQKNSEIKLQIREVEIKSQLRLDENNRFERFQQNEIDQLKSKQDKISQDYEDVLLRQTSLENEIETYRNLLEDSMKPVVDNITEEYNSITANQTKFEPKVSSSTRSTRSPSTDRNSSKPYTSYYDNYQSTDSSSSVIDLPATNGTGLTTSKNLEDTTDQHPVEIKIDSSLPNIRLPINIPIRRDNN